MRIATEKSAVLEMRGPRQNGWRSAQDRIYDRAKELVYTGQYAAAIHAAETAHIEEHGDMHGFAFRVVETSRSVITTGPWSDVIPE